MTVSPLRWLCACGLWLILAVAQPLQAQPATIPADAATRLAEDGFSATEAAIGLIAASGAPHAVAALEAMADRRLLFWKDPARAIWRDAAGASFDLLTGEAVASPPAGASLVRVNNRLRGAIQAALGTLTLLSPDPQRRLRAAEAVLRSRDQAALADVETALARETVARVRVALLEARAALILTGTTADRPTREGAIATLVDVADTTALTVLRQVLPTADATLKPVIEAGIASIERTMAIRDVAQTVWFGLSLGSVLLLAAIGLAITFGVMGVINMAHGEMVMIGAYVTFVVQEVIRTHAPHLFDWSLPIAIPLAFVCAGAVGIAIERGIIRFLYGRPLETLLATFGVSLVLQQAIRTWFGPTNREVGAPSYMSGFFEVWGLQITYGRLWILVFTLVVFACLLLVLRATPLGLQMRAVTQNRRMASAMGIRTRFVDAMTFGLGSGIAGIAGVALSQIDNVSPNLGQSYIIDSFMVVVFGGVGNLWGTLVAAFTLGIANKVLEPFAGAVLGKILILILLILFIQKRPRGLFALKGRAVEQ
ncbi:MAG: urea ABC transporter permease subunit UrtB [Alphaproteobacteria bacterium]|nr:MAG: urea ABC transporter permease subunit UrtB [Alphaproteobacteria bacterium]